MAVALGALAIGFSVPGVAMAQAPAGAVRVAYTVEPYTPPSMVTINGTGVRLRAEPSTATQVLSSGSTGLQLTVVGLARMSDWTWYQVILKSGQKAFIRSDLTSAPMRGGAPAAPAMPAPVTASPPAYTPPAYTPTPTAALPPAPNPPAYTPAPTASSTGIAPLTPTAPSSTMTPTTPAATPAPSYAQQATLPPVQPYTQPPAQTYTQAPAQPITQPAAQPSAPASTGGSGAIWLTPGPASPTTTSGLESAPQR